MDIFCLILLLFFPVLHVDAYFGVPQSDRNCMDEDYLCFDVTNKQTYSLGDKEFKESDVLFSMSAHRHRMPNTTDEHVWTFDISPSQTKANVSIVITPKGESSTRKLVIRKVIGGQKSKVMPTFHVMNQGNWSKLPPTKLSKYFKREAKIVSENSLFLISTSSFSKLMKLENMKYTVSASISSWGRFEHYDFTVTTSEDFYLFKSKVAQGVAGQAKNQGTIIVAVVIGILSVAALVVLIVFLTLRSKRNHLMSTTTKDLSTDLTTFRSIDSRIMNK